MWSSGCVDWWFTDNDKDLETSVAAMRYSLAEAGGIVCMHDSAQANGGQGGGAYLRKFLEDTWNFWQYVDFLTSIDRDDVDEGKVFKTYDEYKSALAAEAAVSTQAEDNSEQLATAAIIGIVLASVFVAVLLTVLALNKRGSFATKAKEVTSNTTQDKEGSNALDTSEESKSLDNEEPVVAVETGVVAPEALDP